MDGLTSTLQVSFVTKIMSREYKTSEFSFGREKMSMPKKLANINGQKVLMCNS